jgi:protocatechuate 3,4-dioxygenase beta subunit
MVEEKNRSADLMVDIVSKHHYSPLRRSSMKALLLSGLLASMLFGVRSQEELQKGTGRIDGVVVSEQTGNPVVGVRVQIRHLQKVDSVLTDESGRFSFMNLLPGRIEIRAEYPAVTNRGVSPAVVTLVPGQQLSDVRLVMDLSGSIAGRVSRESGQPVVRATIAAVRKAYRIDGRCIFEVVGNARTDDRGNYRIFGLPPDQYFVRAENLSQTGEIGGTAPSDMFYPGTLDSTRAQSLRIDADESRERVDMMLTRTLHTSVSGRIEMQSSGEPVTSIRLEFHRLDACDPGSRTVVSQTPAGFQGVTSALPGKYELVASTTSSPVRDLAFMDLALAAYNARFLREKGGRIRVDLRTENLQGVTIPIYDLTPLQGRVRLNSGSPFLQMGGIRFVLTNPDGRYTRRGPLSTDGRFQIPVNNDGRHFFNAEGLPDDAYVVDVLREGKSVYDSGIDFGRKDNPDVEVILDLRGGSLSGVALNSRDEVAASITAVLIPSNRRFNPSLYRMATTDARGAFAFRGILPGDYKVFVFEKIPINAWFNAEYLEQFEQQGTPVRIQEAGRLNNLQFRSIPPARR